MPIVYPGRMTSSPPGGARDTIGQGIRRARNARGRTLEQVSEEIGVSPATLSLIERDKVSVTRARLKEIAAALGADPAELGWGTDPEHEAQLRVEPESERPHVLGAAIECFTRRGYHGTSMREIAQAGHMSVAGVYHYYESKQQMLVSALEPAMVELRDAVVAAGQRHPEDEPEKRFAAMIEVLAIFHITERDIAFLGGSELRSLEGANRERVVQLRRGVQHLVDAEAQAAAVAGAFANPDILFASRMVVNMCVSLARWYDPEGPVGPDDAVANAVAYALAVMKSPAVGA